ncbi:hypothetical protein KP509_10G029100 [Ceratopteris richardii]|uniref:RING-type domain-containing protein n=1 Tax=Ceratopteris richardii TaxID=49495 RepID=A0A8T2U087_CERRI|nr:hypothetical protein KP509_10G029100 [Ceratopteris richardii]
MCQIDSQMEQQTVLNPEKPVRGDVGFISSLPSKVEKSLAVPPTSENGKKKRRAAKLKQCKMDARREQWLAQVSGKGRKSESCDSSHSSSQDDGEEKELLLQASPRELDIITSVNKEGSEDSRHKPPVESSPSKAMGQEWSDGQFHNHLGSFSQDIKHSLCQHHEHEAACSNEPAKHSVERRSEQKPSTIQRYDTQGTWSASDTSFSQSNSSQMSSSSEDENEVDDWETVADALHVQATVEDMKPTKPIDHCLSSDGTLHLKSSSSIDADKCILKPESKYRPGNCGSRTRADAGRAWRPDDLSRPETLPRLSKQHSFPLQSGSLWATSHGTIWGLPPPPSHCPICTEELDTTDSSFVPCSCGFRLCLFCHHRILIGDGRCPGCRKSYNTEAASKLSRACSVRPRV